MFGNKITKKYQKRIGKLNCSWRVCSWHICCVSNIVLLILWVFFTALYNFCIICVSASQKTRKKKNLQFSLVSLERVLDQKQIIKQKLKLVFDFIVYEKSVTITTEGEKQKLTNF